MGWCPVFLGQRPVRHYGVWIAGDVGPGLHLARAFSPQPVPGRCPGAAPQATIARAFSPLRFDALPYIAGEGVGSGEIAWGEVVGGADGDDAGVQDAEGESGPVLVFVVAAHIEPGQ